MRELRRLSEDSLKRIVKYAVIGFFVAIVLVIVSVIAVEIPSIHPYLPLFHGVVYDVEPREVGFLAPNLGMYSLFGAVIGYLTLLVRRKSPDSGEATEKKGTESLPRKRIRMTDSDASILTFAVIGVLFPLWLAAIGEAAGMPSLLVPVYWAFELFTDKNLADGLICYVTVHLSLGALVGAYFEIREHGTRVSPAQEEGRGHEAPVRPAREEGRARDTEVSSGKDDRELEWYEAPVAKLMIAGSITAVVIAAGLLYYHDSRERRCDRAAERDVHRLSAVLERLCNELRDANCTSFWKELSEDHLKFLVGTYYGWRAPTYSCGILVRMANGEIHTCAMRGTHPTGNRKDRHVYRIQKMACQQGAPNPLKSLPTIVGPCTGKAYGYRKTGDHTYAPYYEESIIEPETCRFRKPRSMADR